MGTLDKQLVVAVSRFDRDPDRRHQAAQPLLDRFIRIVDTFKITLVSCINVQPALRYINAKSALVHLLRHNSLRSSRTRRGLTGRKLAEIGQCHGWIPYRRSMVRGGDDF